jgi:hypothetical protein
MPFDLTKNNNCGLILIRASGRLEGNSKRSQTRKIGDTMKSLATSLLIGIILGAGGYWAWHGSYQPPVVAQSVESAEATKESLAAKMEALELRAYSINQELAEAGRVVRRRARDLGESVADTVADAAITATIKAELAADPDLSAWSIPVSTTSGVVNLSGNVSSPEDIGRTILFALNTEGVNLVISTMQVRQPTPQENAGSNTKP